MQHRLLQKMQQRLFGNGSIAEKASRMTHRNRTIRVRSLAQAIRIFETKNTRVKVLKDINFEGARIGRYYRDEFTGEKLLLVFKRQYYFMFSKHFPDVKEKGYGVMNNLKLTHWAALQGAKIAAMFEDGNCYKIDGLEFYLYYEKHGTDVMAVPGEIASPLCLWEPAI